MGIFTFSTMARAQLGFIASKTQQAKKNLFPKFPFSSLASGEKEGRNSYNDVCTHKQKKRKKKRKEKKIYKGFRIIDDFKKKTKN